MNNYLHIFSVVYDSLFQHLCMQVASPSFCHSIRTSPVVGTVTADASARAHRCTRAKPWWRSVAHPPHGSLSNVFPAKMSCQKQKSVSGW